jgi:hypothetical protein
MQDPNVTLTLKEMKGIARKLQAGHAMETEGEAKAWPDLPEDEQRMWMRLARRAVSATIKALADADAPLPGDTDL